MAKHVQWSTSMHLKNGHPKCYAQALGKCSSQLSREHYVSDKVLRAISLAQSAVRVSGLRFQPSGMDQELGIGSLTGNILCQKHNSDLSDFDNAGSQFFSAMERLMVTGNSALTLRIKGDQIEAWMLKTMVGGVFCGAFSVPEGTIPKNTLPPQGFLETLFEDVPLIEPLGLYLWHGEKGERLLTDYKVLRIELLFGSAFDHSEKVTLCGVRMWIFGIEFYLSILPLPDPLPGRWQHTVYRPTEIIGPNRASLIIEWKGIGGNRPVRFGNMN